ncbi:MAG: hypothetical protein HQ526_04150 [Actinobacteria bacterium]|nr:hypothetical protein [Actinomycetota bacterium]
MLTSRTYEPNFRDSDPLINAGFDADGASFCRLLDVSVLMKRSDPDPEGRAAGVNLLT